MVFRSSKALFEAIKELITISQGKWFIIKEKNCVLYLSRVGAAKYTQVAEVL
jgi:hypothetical protein